MANKNKATHQGECQACTRTQLLPQGKLSKHGYEVAGYGFFNGVCRGASHLPYEQDKSLIQTCIDEATADLTRTTEYAAKLNAPATEPKCKVNVYVTSKNRYIPSGYKWCDVTLYAKSASYVSGGVTHTYERFYYDAVSSTEDGAKPTTHEVSLYGTQKTLLGVATERNQDFVERVLDPHVAQLTEYIRWQTQRRDNWTLRDLKPAPAPVVPDPNRKPRFRRQWR